MPITETDAAAGPSTASDDNPPPPPLQKKYSVQRRLEKKRKRNAGESYETLDGKVKKARVMEELPDCKKKCAQKLSLDVRKEINRVYWALGSRDKRAQFVSNCSEQKPPATRRLRNLDNPKQLRRFSNKFFFMVENEKISVCKGCFSKVLVESYQFINTAIDKTSDFRIQEPDRRGKETTNSISTRHRAFIVNHINSFPAYESHYSRRHTKKKYLPHYLNLSILYDLYREECKKAEMEAVSKVSYSSVFKSLGLSFKSPKLDTCNRCDEYEVKIKSSSGEEQSKLKNEKEQHVKDADFTYDVKKTDKTRAQTSTNMRCFTFDLQQCLPS